MSGFNQGGFHITFTHLGPDGTVIRSTMNNQQPNASGSPFGGPGIGMGFPLFASPGAGMHPLAALLGALGGGMPPGFVMNGAGMPDGDFESQLQRLFAMHQPAARPASKQALDELVQVPVSEQDVAAKTTCSVCMEEFKLSDMATKLPCTHMFHKDCLMPWLQSNHTCPVCRFALKTEDSAPPSASVSSDSNASAGPQEEEEDEESDGASQGLFSFLEGLARPRDRTGSRHSRGSRGPRGDPADLDARSRFDDAFNPTMESIQRLMGTSAALRGNTERDNVSRLDEDDDELAAAIAASLEDYSGATAATSAAAVSGVGRRASVGEPDVQALMLESLLSLSVEDLQAQCITENIQVPIGATKEELVNLLATSYGLPITAPATSVSASSVAASHVEAVDHGVTGSFSSRVTIPVEPSASEPDVFNLRLRFPDGSSIIRRFSFNTTIEQIAAFITSTDKRAQFTVGADGTPHLRIRDSAPPSSTTRTPVFDSANWSLSLGASGLSKRSQLIVEPLT
jgi:hypothetical protein